MYYTTSGAYRKSKMIIDYANMEKNKVAGVILAITAVVLLVLSAMCFAAVLK